MAIKVKHEGSVASRLAASAAGGAAKRAMEAAALAKPSQIQTLAPAHASAPGVSTPHAQLISAPGGGAHAGLIGGGGGIGARFGGLGRGSAGGQSAGAISSRRGSGSGGDGSGDYKVTGTSIFNRPDDDSVWREDLRQWIRPWLPGEKEAEALGRTGEVQNDLIAERELTAQGRRERAALVNDVVDAIKQGRFSREEMPKLLEQFGDAEDTIRMADALRDSEPSPEEKFRKNTFTDANGVVFSTDGKVLYNPNDTAMRREEFAAKREDALKARADKYELELRKPVVSYDSDGVKQSTMRTDEEIQQLMQRRFPELYPSAPQSAQMPIDEARQALDPFAQYGGYESLVQTPTPASAANPPPAEPPPTEDPNDPLAAFKKYRN